MYVCIQGGPHGQSMLLKNSRNLYTKHTHTHIHTQGDAQGQSMLLINLGNLYRTQRRLEEALQTFKVPYAFVCMRFHACVSTHA